ncbi:protein phosphatase 2C domain-containing protein [Streptomyces sp. HNM0574]|uniref:protein phosphatase 2C domain-containing protein n=1 Tax=Streptomyces sp. HNM0574 TaxID=2714954 RepID=UPI00146BAB7C|nr:protein phosphatase 2C domain-containing protein [Streptomyces sp. HNM0574]NLU67165.1 hypothetical protein [Streptomyces sp. HNM0574]
MRSEMTSEPGSPPHPNEDYASVALPASGEGGVLVVLDGVTPPEGDDGCVHGVPWFTARLGGAMLELSGSRRELTLAACLSAALARTADAHRSTCDLSHVRTPQATVVAARWDADTVEHLVLSDSSLLLEHPGGAVTPVRDTRLSELPPHVRELGREVRALPEGSPEHVRARAAYVRAVEGLRNAPDGTGFWTAAADPAVAAHAVTGTTPRASVTALLAVTDGASRWTERFRLGTWEQLPALVRKLGTSGLVAQVRAAEAGDVAPRGKRSDDATAVFVEL